MAELIADPHRAARLVLALRQQGVMSTPVLNVMEAVDRTGFAPETAADLAYENVHIAIGCGQTILPPVILAQLLAAVAFEDAPTGRTLIVGAGSGYSTALCAALSEEVIALERHASLAGEGAGRLAALGLHNATILHGDGLEGPPDESKFDRILLMGTVDQVPEALLSALNSEGRLAAPVLEGGVTRVMTYTVKTAVSGPEVAGKLTPLRPGVAHLL